MGKKGKITTFVVLILLGCLVCFSIIFWFQVASPAIKDMQCCVRLTNIGRGIHSTFTVAADSNEVKSENILYIDGKPYFKEKLPYLDSCPTEKATCVCSKKPYVFSSVTPAGTRIPLIRTAGDRNRYFLMWCPEACHKGKRAYLLNSLVAMSLKEDEVSWYYQKLADSLTDEELRKENKYRQSRGLPLLASDFSNR